MRAYYSINWKANGLQGKAEAKHIVDGFKKIGGKFSRSTPAYKIYSIYEKLILSLAKQFHGFQEREESGITYLTVE